MKMTNDKRLDIHDKFQEAWAILNSIVTDFAECDDARSVEVYDIMGQILKVDGKLSDEIELD